MDNQETPKRSLFGIILPYILIALAIAGFVALIITSTSNRSDSWTVSNVDSKLETNEVMSADVYNKETTVTIQGTYLTPENVKKSYTFTCDETWFNNGFDSNGDGAVDHASYRSLFSKEVSDFKTSHGELYGIPYMSDHYAFEVSWFDQCAPVINSRGAFAMYMKKR